jgi:hypothetical protein
MTMQYRIRWHASSSQDPTAFGQTVTITHESPCPKCRRLAQRRVERLVVDARCFDKPWPDILRWQSTGGHGVLLSPSVIEAMSEHGLRGIQSQVLVQYDPIASIDKNGCTPEYYSVELDRDLDVGLTGGEPKDEPHVCAKCSQMISGNTWRRRLHPIDGTWAGSDLFWLRKPQLNRLHVYCSMRFIELARDQRWLGFNFEPIDIDPLSRRGWRGVDHLADQWPPASWYPPDQERHES